MTQQTTTTAPITVRTSKEAVAKMDALASRMDRSRNYLVNQAIEQYLETNAWQIERIQAGLDAANAGDVVPTEDVFARIADKRGWRG